MGQGILGRLAHEVAAEGGWEATVKLGEPRATCDFLSQVAIETKLKFPVDLRCCVSTVKQTLGITLTIKDVLRAFLSP